MSSELAQHVRAHGPTLYRIAWRILGNADEVDDVLQDVVLEAMKVSRREAISSWIGLLKRLTVCRSLDRLRKRRLVEEWSDVNFSPSQSSPLENVMARELEAKLREAIGLLTPRQAEVFSLRYFDDCSNLEIADSLGISTAAVATALRKSRASLSALLSIDPKKGTTK